MILTRNEIREGAETLDDVEYENSEGYHEQEDERTHQIQEACRIRGIFCDLYQGILTRHIAATEKLLGFVALILLLKYRTKNINKHERSQIEYIVGKYLSFLSIAHVLASVKWRVRKYCFILIKESRT